MQNAFSDALSKSLSQHIALGETRHETLTWLAFLIMRQGTICLWRLDAEGRTDTLCVGGTGTADYRRGGAMARWGHREALRHTSRTSPARIHHLQP